MPSRTASRALQDELRDAKQRLKAGGGSGLPKPAELVGARRGRSGRPAGGHRGAPGDSLDELKGLAAGRSAQRSAPGSSRSPSMPTSRSSS